MPISRALARAAFLVAIRASSAARAGPEAISQELPAQAQEDVAAAPVALQGAVVVVAEVAEDSRQAGAGEAAFKAAVHAAEAVDAAPEDVADVAGNRTRL